MLQINDAKNINAIIGSISTVTTIFQVNPGSLGKTWVSSLPHWLPSSTCSGRELLWTTDTGIFIISLMAFLSSNQQFIALSTRKHYQRFKKFLKFSYSLKSFMGVWHGL